MSSGTNYHGGVSRCFYEWQKFMECYTAKDTTDVKTQCKPSAEDYQECLYHRKEIARADAIATEYDRRLAKGESDELPKVEKKYLSVTLKDMGIIES